MIPEIGNAIFGILNARKAQMQQQQEQQAMTQIILQALQPNTETVNRGANTDEIANYINQINSQSAGLAPMPEIPMAQPTPFMSNQPSFNMGMADPNMPQFQPKMQTVGETSGAINANEIDPVKLGEQLGLTQELTKQKSALQMYQSMMEHPLFNSLKPGQADKLIETITGIRKMMPEQEQMAQADPYTLSPGQRRFDAQGNVIAEVPMSDKELAPRNKYTISNGFLLNQEDGTTEQIVGLSPAEGSWTAITTKDGKIVLMDRKTGEIKDSGLEGKVDVAESDGYEEADAKVLADQYRKQGYRGVVVKKLPNGKFDVDKYAPPAPDKPASPTAAFDTYKEALQDIQDNGMVGYYPYQLTNGKWVNRPNIAGQFTGGGNPSMPGVVSPVVPVKSAPDKYKVGQTYKGYKYIGNNQWQKI